MTKMKILGSRLTTSKRMHLDQRRIKEICWTSLENEWNRIRMEEFYLSYVKDTNFLMSDVMVLCFRSVMEEFP